jgi:hypothetical protein
MHVRDADADATYEILDAEPTVSHQGVGGLASKGLLTCNASAQDLYARRRRFAVVTDGLPSGSADIWSIDQWGTSGQSTGVRSSRSAYAGWPSSPPGSDAWPVCETVVRGDASLSTARCLMDRSGQVDRQCWGSGAVFVAMPSLVSMPDISFFRVVVPRRSLSSTVRPTARTKRAA